QRHGERTSRSRHAPGLARVRPSDDPLCRVSVVLLGRHPGATLFPYTTLFRSSQPLGIATGGRHHIYICVPGNGRCVSDLRTVRRDRKSTRLNSSHVAISYAVFCLKKKKNNANNFYYDTISAPFLIK